MALPCIELRSILEPAYVPCTKFGTCSEAIWDPAKGHLPRGFLGATGAVRDVRLIMVFSEPGTPYATASYPKSASAGDYLRYTTQDTHEIFLQQTDQFHRNVRWFLDRVFPNQSFEQQLRHVWLTEGRLCSFAQEIDGKKDRQCAQIFLRQQIDLMPKVPIVAAGGKAQDYLKSLRIPYIACRAFAPPGCNHTPARPSWDAAISAIHTAWETA